MPRRSTERGGRRYGARASQKVKQAMRERKRGSLRSGRSGRRVKSREQAIAIGLNQARREGAQVPDRGGRRRSRSGRPGGQKRTRSRQTAGRRGSRSRQAGGRRRSRSRE